MAATIVAGLGTECTKLVRSVASVSGHCASHFTCSLPLSGKQTKVSLSSSKNRPLCDPTLSCRFSQIMGGVGQDAFFKTSCRILREGPSRCLPPVRAIVEASPAATSGQLVSAFTLLQGLREEMEDELVIKKDAPAGFTYAAIFDGHAGHSSARFLKEELYKEILAALDDGPGLEAAESVAWQSVLERAFQQTDDRLLSRLQELDHPEGDSGSTAAAAFVRHDRVIVAHLGDSRVVLCRGGEAEDLTIDHRPLGESDMARAEIKRVQDAGGWVTKGRLCGQLAISRAFGDLQLKTERPQFMTAGFKKGRWTKRFMDKIKTVEPWVSVVPGVNHVALGDDAEFILLASDGLWDSVTSSEAVRFVRTQLAEHGDAQKACDALAEFAIKERDGEDNVSLVYLQLR
eukprot:jgi/Mesen1/6043/ME000308S05234